MSLVVWELDHCCLDALKQEQYLVDVVAVAQ